MTTPLSLAVVTGANGFLGRWLILALARAGTRTVAMMRKADQRIAELRDWVTRHGGEGALVEGAPIDLDADDLGLDDRGQQALAEADAVYHLAARFGFGLARDVAYRSNVTATLTLVEALKQNKGLKRLVHISGYRTMGVDAQALDLNNPTQLDAFYRSHGAYEASKMEAHLRIAVACEQAGVPLTRVSPSMVIGDSETGETQQVTGMAETLQLLWQGKLPALVGTPDTWLPAITVDALAQILVAVPVDDDVKSANLVVFDDETPTLAEWIARAARRMRRPAPRWTLSVGLVRALPKALTGVEPESLSFIVDDRYDPRPLRGLLDRHGISLPDISVAFDRWLDYLLDTDFGGRERSGGRSFRAAGRRVFARGDRHQPDDVFLHGVLLNEATWLPVTQRLGTRALALDLPGLGHSEPGGGTPTEWLRAALAESSTAPRIIGHSLGTAFAVGYAAAYPDRVRSLVLVAPFFHLAEPSFVFRSSFLMSKIFRFAGAKRMAAQMDGPLDEVRRQAAELLSHRSVAEHNARWLAWAAQPSVRAELRETLARIEVPVTVIVGEHDPIRYELPGRVDVVEVPGAGHYAQLTHVDAVVEALES